MADEVFKVGALRTSAEQTLGFLFQTTSAKVVSKKDEGVDHRGNLKARQNFDHRLQLTVEALLPRGASVPVPGQTVELRGITVPTVAADGTVSGDDFAILDEDGSLSGGEAAIEMTVDTEAEIVAEAEKLTRVRFVCERGLVNGVPAAASSGA